MANETDIKILFNDFPKIEGSLRSQAGRAVSETARDIASQAQSAAPVLTGALRASISAAQAGTFAWVVTVSAAYANFVEFGTGHGPAQPYLTPAAHQAEPELMSKLASYVGGVE